MSSAASSVDFGPTLGAYFIALLLGALFLGITWAQTISYYREYPDDRVFLKLLVGALWVFDTLSFIFLAHAAYTYMIIGFGNFATASSLVWSLGSEPIFSDSICFTVQLFLAWRIQILKPKWRILSVVIALVSLAAFVITIAATIVCVVSVIDGLSFVEVLRKTHWSDVAGNACGSGIAKTDRLLNRLTIFIITTGMIDSALRMSQIILSTVYPTSLYLLIPYISTSKAYTNTVLTTLNSRNRNKLATKVTTIEWRSATADSAELRDMSSKRGQV